MLRSYDFSHWGTRLPKVSCLCPTFGRPHLLGEAVESFLRQDYPGEKELIILNDHGAIPIALPDLPGIKLVNRDQRFGTLGEKRNALATLATGEVFFPWDDDDISLPWRLSITIERMTNRHYFKPDDYWWWTGAGAEYRCGVMAHAMAGYSREIFERVGGYPAINSGEDQEIENLFRRAGATSGASLGTTLAFYIYRLNHVQTYHISSYAYGGGWEECAAHVDRELERGQRNVVPLWNMPYDHLVIPTSTVEPHRENASAANRNDPPKVLVGICSCRANPHKREAVRQTWLSALPGHVIARFFIGGSDGAVPEEDTIAVDAADGYDDLPAKVRAFFRYALEHFEFDYLFKCDDDTYLAAERLARLTEGAPDLVGNVRLKDQGFACGGAGYLLARQWVEAVVGLDLPATGYEDRIITKAAMQAGAVPRFSPDLYWNTEDFPRRDNGVVTAHWCSPGQLRAIHLFHRGGSHEEISVFHPHWNDRVLLFENGLFSRASKPDGGRWSREGGGILRLHWFDWAEESFVPLPRVAGPDESGILPGIPRFELGRAVETVTVELSGGLGNQMFQYAHGLALARRLGADLKLTYRDYARQFSLGLFGIGLDEDIPSDFQLVEDLESCRPDQEWPSFQAVAAGLEKRHVRLRGFFQHESYFAPVADELRATFRLSHPLPGSEDVTRVCIHVRRGDFSGCRKHDVCKPEYYGLAVRVARSLLKKPEFHVYSDDPEWCRKHLDPAPDLTVMDKMDEADTFRAMASHEAFILSNSTFGWWASWLADAAFTVAPNRFLADRRWETSRESWIQLPADGCSF